MSLVRFAASNHPQQVGRDGARDDVDDRGTTDEIFSPLHRRFRFTLDVAAAPHNAKLPRFYTAADNGLAMSWANERVWCNPPYSDIGPWVEKAWHSDAALVVMLAPANRTEQNWWQWAVEPFRDNRGGSSGMSYDLAVEFLPGRIRFLRPGQSAIGPNERPPFGCCLLIWRRKRAA